MSGEFRVRGRDPRSEMALELTIADGVIRSIESVEGQSTLPWIAPGLVDLQVNGFSGFDANGPDVTASTIAGLSHALAAVGTTTYVPTVVTESEDRIRHSLMAIADAHKSDPMTAHAVPYVHLEGPHISDQDGARGVHPASEIRPPDLREFDRWQKAADGLVGMVTLSPHFPGVSDYIAELTARGVIVSIGHTHATSEEIHVAADAGARLSTHLGNGAHSVLARHPNYIWAQLSDDRLVASFIADGHHLPDDTLTAMIRAKGDGGSILVSDSVALAGCKPGIYSTPVGGAVELTTEGRLGEVGTPFLAGAARPLADGVAKAARLAGVGMRTALEMATAGPGRFATGRGILQPGASADLIVFDFEPGDRSLAIREVVAAGRRVLDAHGTSM